MDIATIGSILGIVLALGAIGAWLVSHGKHLAEQTENRKDIDDIDRMVEHVRKELQSKIDCVEQNHNELAREVSEIVSTTRSTEKKVDTMDAKIDRIIAKVGG